MAAAATVEQAKEQAANAEKPHRDYVVAAVLLVIAGLLIGFLLERADVRYEKPAAGISVFAVLYVLAQGVERVVEFVINVLTVRESFAENRKRGAVAVLNSTRNGNPSLADLTDGDVSTSVSEAKTARADLAVLSQGLAFALAFCLVSYVEYGIFQVIGVEGLDAFVDRVLTAIAVMGGAKGLHELVGKIQKSKEADAEKKG